MLGPLRTVVNQFKGGFSRGIKDDRIEMIPFVRG